MLIPSLSAAQDKTERVGHCILGGFPNIRKIEPQAMLAGGLAQLRGFPWPEGPLLQKQFFQKFNLTNVFRLC